MEELKPRKYLAQNLFELGYRKTFADYEINTNYYVKYYEDVMQVICIDSDSEVLIHSYFIKFDRNITSQKDLDNIQIAFNRIQSDIKILYGAQYE